MTNNKQHIRRSVFCGCAVLILFFAVLILNNPLSRTSAASSSSDSELKKLQDSLSSATANRKEAQKAYNDAKDKKAGLIEQKAVLDEEIIAVQKEYEAIEKLIDEYDAQLRRLGSDIDATEYKLDGMLDTLKGRLRLSYEDGFSSYINIVFESENLTEFLTQLEWVSYLLNYDKSLINDCSEYQKKLSDEENQVTILENEAKVKISELAESKKLAEEKRTEVEALMADVDEDIEKAKELYNKYYENEKAFDKQIEDLIAERQRQNQTSYVGGSLLWPLPKSDKYVTSPFGYRVHPITGAYEFHTGIDISSHLGTNIYSVNKGVVAEAAFSRGNGNYVLIDHGGGTMSYYSHLSKILVTKNQEVKQGEVIGLVGMTGLATGYHLHFSMYQNGKAVDPLGYYDTSWMIMYY